MSHKNSVGRFTPPKITPPQSPREEVVDVSSSSDEVPVSDGVAGTTPAAPTVQPTPESLEGARNKLLTAPTLALPVTEDGGTCPSGTHQERRCPKGLVSYAVWMGVGAAVMAPVVVVAAYLEPGSFDSPPIEKHPGWVIPLSAVVGGAAGGAMRYLHQRLFG